MKLRVAVVLALAAGLLLPRTPAAFDDPYWPNARIHLNRDLDGPSGYPVFTTAQPAPPQRTPPVTLAFFDFEGAPHDPQGWTTVDRTAEAGVMFHVDAADFAGGNLDGGDFGRLTVIGGNKSLWCGAAPGGAASTCSYTTLPGYGNHWTQIFVSDPMPRGDDPVFADFKVRFDLETNYDFAYFEYETPEGDWEPLLLETAGEFYYTGRSTDLIPGGIVHDQRGTPSGDHPDGYTRWRWRVVTDAAGSDEDGLYNSDGALIVDEIQISSGGVLNTEDFESDAIGATSTVSGVWHAEAMGFGDFAALYPGTALLQQSPPLDPADLLTTCVWTFTDGSPDKYDCGGFPAEPAIPYGSPETGYMNNDIRSPWITWEPVGGQTTHLSFDAYMDLPLDGGVFFTIYVRQRSDGGCPTPWRGGEYVYYRELSRFDYDFDLTRYMGPVTAGTDEIQVALNVLDYEITGFAGAFPSVCHTNAPLFDNVEVYLDNTHSWEVNDLALFQDNFPANGTTSGSIRADAANGGDEARFFVTEPGVGLDLENQNPAVFCHVKTLPGKAGAAVSGGQQWPEVVSMSDADWTVLQCAPAGTPNEFSIDLNDTLYEAGDVVWFYFSARDANAVTTYYSQFTGRVNTEAEARAYPMEFTGLPTGTSNVLYVDSFSGHGAEPYFNTSFAELGITPDRLDVRAPSSGLENHLGDLATAAATQLIPYNTIIYNSGDLGLLSIKGGTFSALDQWIQNHPGPQLGLYLSGDDLARTWDASQESSAQAFKQYCDFDVVLDDHRAAGEPDSPAVVPAGGSPFAGSLVAYGDGPAPGRFDVLSAGPNASVGMEYNPSTAPALVYQSSAAPNGVVNVVLSGFSHHVIRDDDNDGISDRTEFLAEVMNYTSGAGLVPSGATPTVANRLDQNVPNPFNPATSISYAIREAGAVSLRIYDVKGRLVRTLVNEVQPARGEGYTVTWDGRSDAGQRVATGVYFYRLDSPGFSRTRKMVLLK